MGINWSEKNTAELELFFLTDVKKGLSREQYSQSKEQYGENIIDSDILEQQNFYGLQKKKRNIKAMLSGSVGIIGLLYFLTVIILRIMNFDVNIYALLPFYLFLIISAFILYGSSEKKYERLYKIARPKALVIRNNRRKKVFIENIVPGDIILISAGDIVPADARLVTSNYLSCLHINKDGAITKEGKTAEIIRYSPSSEMSGNIVYAADVVDYGSASGVVIATGKDAYISRISNNENENNNYNEDYYDYDDYNGNFVNPNANKQNNPGYSFMQKCVSKLSGNLFLASVFLSTLIIFIGLFQERDFAAVFVTCMTVSIACFPEQINIISDFSVVYGLHRLSKFGILVKKTKIIDGINSIDTVIAKKSESYTQDKMKLSKISDYNYYNTTKAGMTGYILSCISMCLSVTEHGGQNKKIYTGSAIDVAVFEALKKYGLTYDAINQSYQKIGKTVYNPRNGIKSAVVIINGKFTLVCFGEAFNIVERCREKTRDGRYDKKSLDFFREKKEKIGDLYKEHDLIMAVAIKDFDYRNAKRIWSETESNLNFLGFVSFSEPKTSAVFESIDYLKKSGVSPVMFADSDNAQNRNAAVKFGIVKNHASANILNDGKITKMGDSMFYIQADKFKLFTPIALENRVKLLKALRFKKKYPAMTINDIEELSLLNEPCVAFTSVNTETGILKNKASVITKNLTVSTILKTIKNAVLIYRNTCNVAHYWSMLFFSQYLLIFFAVLFNGAYILNSAQIIWSGIALGYVFAISICFNEENRRWHVLRTKIKEYKKPDKFNGTILKYGFIYGILIFLFVILSFFISLIINNPIAIIETIKQYINSDSLDNTILKSAQTSAFITYSIALMSIAFYTVKGSSFFDLKIFRNKVFIIGFILNLLAVLCVVLIPVIRDFLEFGEIDAKIAIISAVCGFCPLMLANFFVRDNIFFKK